MPVVTSNEETDVRITWQVPTYNGGSPILGYRITIKTFDGDYIEDLDNCDGADQTTKANLYCIIPMATLRAEPYNLILSQTIVALVEARNIIGYNWTPSDENTGDAELRTEPLAPLSIVTRVDEDTTDITITVYYPNFYTDEETGGSPILSLNLWYD